MWQPLSDPEKLAVLWPIGSNPPQFPVALKPQLRETVDYPLVILVILTMPPNT